MHDKTALLPLAPKNPLPYRQRARAIRSFHTGIDQLRDAGGPVSRVTLGPKWLIPPIVVATSPEAIHDILTNRDGSLDKTSRVLSEFRRVMGDNLFDLPHAQWLPRRRTLQPVFTKQQVQRFGGHMAEAAESVSSSWQDGHTINLDTECRKLTMRALGRAVLGMDLTEHVAEVTEPLRTALTYVVSRALHPLRAPAWLPTPARRRARAAAATLHRLATTILRECRARPDTDAPLVQALIEAKDPLTKKRLSDSDIAAELILFLFAGHDTTATTLAYAMWQLGRHPEIQSRVAAEVAKLPDRQLRPQDIPRLPYTGQVLMEALRMCPPGATGTRMATRDVEIAGYRVEAGTLVAFGRMAVHRDPTLWDRPSTFDPDRFSPQHMKDHSRWQYIPFGAGPRSCIGDHFAMLEATLGLATFIRRAAVHSLHTDFPLTAPFTIVADGPIWARVQLRH
ncbi:Pentalenene oxygenase [Mycobacterium simulans]|uniref:Pentalenene oxygenase n=1 Tax=Mycobacterium simulans TaxID=627089 RepID=A0A7Z7IHZ3_9MYCO|nr:cytochrome P450 [Mycobacterium simulans]SOJ53888.1 Pentalenene oxygenase [Mycobacterium simulans]